ncbi:hypothetical protein [Demequina pelophila]|uniref:hypothetical protein n=1 Tax=Demequina pelophila TaxID=1638984 RepID=UPI00078248E5|nr:hypothetical protein [Demequina pelophila]
MSDTPPATETVATVDATRAAWLATAIGIPVFGACALILAYAAAPLVGALAPDAHAEERGWIFSAVAITNAVIALFGIALVSHTLGRALFASTRERSPAAAGAAFAVLGSVLAIIPVVIVATGQSLPLVGGLYAALAVGLPCGLTAGLTRAVLPGVLAAGAARLALWTGALGYLVVIAWTAVAVFGVGR